MAPNSVAGAETIMHHNRLNSIRVITILRNGNNKLAIIVIM